MVIPICGLVALITRTTDDVVHINLETRTMSGH